MAKRIDQTIDQEWVSFPGGELEGRRPKALCAACREALAHRARGTRTLAPGTSTLAPRTGTFAPDTLSTQHAAPSTEHRDRDVLCFECYRAELDRERAIRAAGQLDTGSEARFQEQLPFEPLDRPRLEMLKAERTAERTTLLQGAGRFVDKRRRAQIAARHALQAIAAGLRERRLAAADRERLMAFAVHAAELQLPESWLPFVVSR